MLPVLPVLLVLLVLLVLVIELVLGFTRPACACGLCFTIMVIMLESGLRCLCCCAARTVAVLVQTFVLQVLLGRLLVYFVAHQPRRPLASPCFYVSILCITEAAASVDLSAKPDPTLLPCWCSFSVHTCLFAVPACRTRLPCTYTCL